MTSGVFKYFFKRKTTNQLDSRTLHYSAYDYLALFGSFLDFSFALHRQEMVSIDRSTSSLPFYTVLLFLGKSRFRWSKTRRWCRRQRSKNHESALRNESDIHAICLQKKKYEPPIPTRIGKRKKRTKGPEAANKLPQVLPYTRCRLKQLRFERIKDYLLLEEEFIKNQERLKPQEDRHEVSSDLSYSSRSIDSTFLS